MQVDEYDIVKVQTGMKVLVTMDSYKGQVFEAKVTHINPLMNERTRTFEEDADFVNPPAVLYPNTSFEANILLQSKERALLVPRNFLIGDSLAIKTRGDTVSVKTGLKDFREIEILSGITAGDELQKPAQ
jgi:multidrug efflux pump subunit AcrA (membrane-fusion protein)